jgi:hypothetical protein
MGTFVVFKTLHMKRESILIIAAFFLCISGIRAQVIPAHPTTITKGTYWGLSRPLRDIPPMTQAEFRLLEKKGRKNELNEGLGRRYYPFAATALPKGDDPAWQRSMGSAEATTAPIVNFDGQTSPYYPPDCNGAAGPNHFMQTVNCVYSIYTKTGTLVAGPTNINQLFGSVPGANRNDGDPIVLYDEQADRWFVTEFSIPYTGPNYILLAVSTTNDPTGTWHQYSFQVASMPDYPKFGIWRDGYYMGDNNSSGNDIYVFERDQILTGGTAQMVGFNNSWRPSSVDGFMCVPPIDNDGAFAPAGSPGMFIAFNDDAMGGGNDQLWLYELTVNWTNPTASTFNRTQQIDVLPFNANFGNNWNNIEQKGTTQRVDGIPQVIMNVPQYRNFGAYQTIVCCHTVNVDGVRHAGIRWYELRKTTGDWTLRQQGTYAPDVHSRWMGSIMLNGSNKIALGYSISSTSMFPSIKYCGQSPEAYAAGQGIMDIPEDTIQSGAFSQSGVNRWGDYSLMSVDPADDETFWFTDQYIGSGGSRKTKIASFKFITGPPVTTQPATAVTSVSATLNGTVNPLGVSTDYHFEWGLEATNLSNSTPTISAGSGSSVVNISADITGLNPATPYFFRAVGVNTTGTGNGNTVRFVTSAVPTLSVNPPNQDVSTLAGNTTFDVASNIGWSVSSDAEWCTVTPSGTGNDTIFATYGENTTVGQRIAHITVTGTGVSPQTVTVTQMGIPVILNVTPPNRAVASTVGFTNFNVTSNTDWTVSSGAAWITVTPAGTGNDTIHVTFTENPAITERIASVTVSASGIGNVTVTVTQSGAPIALNVSPPNQNVAYSAGNTSFTVTSNTNWSVTSDAPWCTVTPSGSGNGTIVADFTVNTASVARVANISVSVASLPVQTVTVTQARSSIGIDDQQSSGLRISPNPTRGMFRILPANGDRGRMDVTVADLQGKIILKKEFSGKPEYEIDLSSAAEGTYEIVIRTAAELVVKKLVIIR